MRCWRPSTPTTRPIKIDAPIVQLDGLELDDLTVAERQHLELARLFDRDVRLFRLYEGTTQIQQIIIARNMVREARNA